MNRTPCDGAIVHAGELVVGLAPGSPPMGPGVTLERYPDGAVAWLDGEIVDAGPGRALGERSLHARHGLDLALDLGLDPAVRHVTDETGHALADGGILHEVAEADALDAAADEITTGHDHDSGAPVPPGTGTPHKDGMRSA